MSHLFKKASKKCGFNWKKRQKIDSLAGPTGQLPELLSPLMLMLPAIEQSRDLHRVQLFQIQKSLIIDKKI